MAKSDEALVIARSQFNEHPEDPYGPLVYAVFLYVARRYEEALELVWRSIPGEEKSSALLNGLILIARDQREADYRYNGATIPTDCLKALGLFKGCVVSDKEFEDFHMRHDWYHFSTLKRAIREHELRGGGAEPPRRPNVGAA